MLQRETSVGSGVVSDGLPRRIFPALYLVQRRKDGVFMSCLLAVRRWDLKTYNRTQTDSPKGVDQ